MQEQEIVVEIFGLMPSDFLLATRVEAMKGVNLKTAGGGGLRAAWKKVLTKTFGGGKWGEPCLMAAGPGGFPETRQK